MLDSKITGLKKTPHHRRKHPPPRQLPADRAQLLGGVAPQGVEIRDALEDLPGALQERPGGLPVLGAGDRPHTATSLGQLEFLQSDWRRPGGCCSRH